MNRQVLTIGADGSISGLQRKPGQGVDLRQFGSAQIKRASEIEWQEGRQRWAVRFLSGPYTGKLLNIGIAEEAGVSWVTTLAADLVLADHEGNTLMWVDYDHAVKAEIAVLDALRVAGQMTPVAA